MRIRILDFKRKARATKICKHINLYGTRTILLFIQKKHKIQKEQQKSMCSGEKTQNTTNCAKTA